MDFFAAVGVPFESALSRTGASFTFLSCSFWALFLHCCVDFGWLGIADLMVMMGVGKF